MSQEKLKVAILPDGHFGTALVVPLSENVSRVDVYVRSTEEAELFERTRENKKYFPNVRLPENVHFSSDLEGIVRGAERIVSAYPTRVLRVGFSKLAPFIREDAIVVSASKGVEEETGLRPSQVIRQLAPSVRRLAVLSGPNYAHEIVRGLPVATVIASEDDNVALAVQRLFRTKRFKPYITDDVIGVELGGTLKNLIAMAVGIAEGMEMGSSGSAALMNRGIKEATRLAVVLGADERTLAGLACAADTVLSSRRPGRNYDAGFGIAQGADPESLKNSGKTIEGLDSIRPIVLLAQQNLVEIPIIELLYEIVSKQLKPYEAIERLMERNNYIYEDPQPIINRRLRFPLRVLNRFLHLWGKRT